MANNRDLTKIIPCPHCNSLDHVCRRGRADNNQMYLCTFCDRCFRESTGKRLNYPHCPHCRFTKVSKHRKVKGNQSYRCQSCKKSFFEHYS